jgi:ABC-2 type transport system ATP-binding protein
VELKVKDGSRAAVDVVRTLDHEGLEPMSLTLREPTLDDVFLMLTGHAAEEPPPEEPAAVGGRGRTRGAA